MKYKRFRETRKQIIVLDEWVEMTWTSSAKAYYESLGYQYTGWNDKFWCRVGDLPSTNKKVLVRCPVCEEERETRYSYVLRVGHTVCGSCTKITDLTGMKFGRLTVLELDKTRKPSYWICRCDCGAVKSISANSMVHGGTVSCGCFNRTNNTGENSVFWNGGQISNTCEHCGGEYKIKRSKKDSSRFCSRECLYAWVSQNKSGKNSHAWMGGGEQIPCDWCGKMHQRATSQLATNNFCSRKCKGRWFSENIVGAAHPMWNPDLTDEERIIGRGYPEIRQWTQNVLHRDSYTCQICGSTENVEAHHMYSYKHFPQYRFVIEYGETMCRSCHISFHSWMGGSAKMCVPSDLDRWLYSQ